MVTQFISVNIRLKRFGNAITKHGVLNLRQKQYATDFGPVEDGCTCPICRPRSEGGMGVTRAFVYHIATKETVGAHLLTMHNVHYQLELMRQARKAILKDEFPEYVAQFFSDLYNGDKTKYPSWAVDALRNVNIDLLEE